MVHAKFNSRTNWVPRFAVEVEPGPGFPGFFLGESRVQIIKTLRQFAFVEVLSKKTNCCRCLSAVARGAAPKRIT
jgi:hypothetical protein